MDQPGHVLAGVLSTPDPHRQGVQSELGVQVPDRSAIDALNPIHRAGRAIDGQDQDGSRVYCDSFDGGGARLDPCGITTATPQHFHRGLPADR